MHSRRQTRTRTHAEETTTAPTVPIPYLLHDRVEVALQIGGRAKFVGHAGRGARHARVARTARARRAGGQRKAADQSVTRVRPMRVYI